MSNRRRKRRIARAAQSAPAPRKNRVAIIAGFIVVAVLAALMIAVIVGGIKRGNNSMNDHQSGDTFATTLVPTTL